MGVRLVFKVVTLNDLEPRSGRYFALFYPKPEPTALKQKKLKLDSWCLRDNVTRRF